MAQCTECGEVVGFIDIKDGICKKCLSEGKIPEPTVEKKVGLTEEEKSKIIQEEKFRKKIQPKTGGNMWIATGFVVALISTFVYPLLLIPAFIIVVIGIFIAFGSLNVKGGINGIIVALIIGGVIYFFLSSILPILQPMLEQYDINIMDNKTQSQTIEEVTLELLKDM